MKKIISTAETQIRQGSATRRLVVKICLGFSLCLGVSAVQAFAQPEPGPVRPVSIPAVQERKLKNGLTVAVIEKTGTPIVTAQLLVKAGANSEDSKKAGLANLTGALLTKGTKTRSAEQIAEEMEFLGASIDSGAGWNGSSVTIGVTSDKVDQAMAIMADVALNPAFKQEELDLLRSQELDGLKYNLAQPGFLATYVGSRYSFNEHPAGGTPTSLEGISRADIQNFYSGFFNPGNSVLIVTGDITLAKATALAEAHFGKWGTSRVSAVGKSTPGQETPATDAIVKRILVVDLPSSGQASVNYFKPVNGLGRKNKDYYSASVLNSLLGGGYSSRLNLEIRIKRGLSYGAGSQFTWRGWKTNFGTRTQTKNESAAEVAELVVAELKRLKDTDAADTELGPRKSVLTGGFGRNLETTGGLTGALAELYSFGIPTAELNSYMTNVNAVGAVNVKEFAGKYLSGGDIIIVGDYAKFKDDLAKRFPNMKIDVIKAEEVNIDSPTLRKSDIP